MSRTLQRNIRVKLEQGRRIENAANPSNSTANQIVIESAVEALDRREWPRAKHSIRLLRSAVFTARTMICDMITAGHTDEVEQIRRSIAAVVLDLPGDMARTISSSSVTSEDA